MLTAVRAALARGSAIGKRDAERTEIEQRLNSLSGREREVLLGLVGGQPNKIIAHNLGISPRTVEIYRANVMSKMDAPSLSDLVRMAMIAGVFE
jgi:two-component system response regulator FixJ